jgi:uncharacterized protein (DUF2237 family)
MKNLFFILLSVFFLSTSKSHSQDSSRRLVIVGCDEWGRASKKCAGWGLCNARWFYWEEKTSGLGFNYPVLLDPKTNEYYLNIKLDDATKKKYSTEDLNSMIIDDDIFLNTKSALGKDLTISKGKYIFDKTLDGYFIPLK